MTRKFAVLETRMSPEARGRSDALHHKHVAEMSLSESHQDQAYASVWEALSDTPAEAANLRVWSELMQQLAALIQERSWTRAEVAQYSDIDQFHAHDLLHGSVSRFSLDALIDIAAKLGQQVRVRLEPR